MGTPDLTPLEAAEMCDGIADGYEIDQQEGSDYHDEWIKKLRAASFYLRKIANKRLVDKDELLKIFGKYVERRGNIICNEMGLQDILDIVEDAPEVISFKKGGEK